MKKFLKISITAIAVTTTLVVAFLFIKARQADKGKILTDKEFKDAVYPKFKNPGSVKSLTILPLIDFKTDNKELRTGAGVSYLIEADDTTILMDAGYNKNGEHPSPLLQNMEKLKVSLDDIDMIYFSHYHMDHVGGRREMNSRTFSISQGPTDISGLPVYTPEEMKPSKFNPGLKAETTKDPRIFRPGIATTGAISRHLYIAGLVYEQCLAVNVQGKGLVLIIGCGHQSIERIITRTKMLFDIPIHAVIGSLHYPVKGGRMMIGPVDIQHIAAADAPPWRGLTEDDVKKAINSIKQEKLSLVSLSPHDSSDWTLDLFKEAFKDKYIDLKVGEKISI